MKESIKCKCFCNENKLPCTLKKIIAETETRYSIDHIVIFIYIHTAHNAGESEYCYVKIQNFSKVEVQFKK